MLAALRSEELRRLVTHIDAAVNGEAVRAGGCCAPPRSWPRSDATELDARTRCSACQALEAAMQLPRFREFADHVLEVLRSGSAAGK